MSKAYRVHEDYNRGGGMKKKKLLAAAIVLCMVIQLLCACGKQKISMSDKVYVGVTCYDQNDTFLSELLVCFKEELNHLNKNGVETTVTVQTCASSDQIGRAHV